MKKLKVITSKSPTETHLIRLIESDSQSIAELAMECCKKYFASTTGRVLFKSAIPKTKNGLKLAEIRNNIGRTRIYLRSIADMQ